MAEKYLNDADICELLRCAKEQDSEEKLEAAVVKVNALLKRFLQVAKMHGKRFSEKAVYSASEKLIGHCRTLKKEPHRKYEMSAAMDDALRLLTIALLNVEGTEGGGSRILMQVRKDDPPQDLERIMPFISPRTSEGGTSQQPQQQPQSIVSPRKQQQQTPLSPRSGPITNAPVAISNTSRVSSGNGTAVVVDGSTDASAAAAPSDAKPKKPRKPSRKLAFADDDADTPKKEEPAPKVEPKKEEVSSPAPAATKTDASPKESSSAEAPKKEEAAPPTPTAETKKEEASPVEKPAAEPAKPEPEAAPKQAEPSSTAAAPPQKEPSPPEKPVEAAKEPEPTKPTSTDAPVPVAPAASAAPAEKTSTPAPAPAVEPSPRQQPAPAPSSSSSSSGAPVISAGVASAIASLASSGVSSSSPRLNSSEPATETRPRKDSKPSQVITAETAGKIISMLNISPRRCRTVISVVDQNEVKRIKETQIAIFTADQKRAFVLVGYNEKGTATLLEAKQNGTCAELRELLRDDQAHFALLRVPLTTAADSKCKDVFISWIGPKVGLKEKVRVQGHVGAMKIVLAPAHYDIQAVNKTSFTEERVQRLLDPSSGSHVID